LICGGGVPLAPYLTTGWTFGGIRKSRGRNTGEPSGEGRPTSDRYSNGSTKTRMTDPFHNLPKGHFGAILADPPWRFETWDKKTAVTTIGSAVEKSHYETMTAVDIYRLPVPALAAPDSVLFIWVIWPMLEHGMKTIEAWGFKYKTCGFAWMKANGRQVEMFQDEITADMLTGYWTRANSEVCLLATRGNPRRINADVRQGIIAPRREHSRKPDGIHERIERLVGGPYLELFARQQRPGWTVWGNQTDKFEPVREAAE
jgi:N6-adenosine-specific RNA methylase IME4